MNKTRVLTGKVQFFTAKESTKENQIIEIHIPRTEQKTIDRLKLLIDEQLEQKNEAIILKAKAAKNIGLLDRKMSLLKSEDVTNGTIGVTLLEIENQKEVKVLYIQKWHKAPPLLRSM